MMEKYNTIGFKVIQFLLFIVIGITLLFLNIATAFKFSIDADGHQVEQIINITLFRYDAQLMYLAYYALFFPIILLIESLFIKASFSIFHSILFLLQSLLLISAIGFTLFVLIVSGISESMENINRCIIIGVNCCISF